jgi:hypothetical protein
MDARFKGDVTSGTDASSLVFSQSTIITGSVA